MQDLLTPDGGTALSAVFDALLKAALPAILAAASYYLTQWGRRYGISVKVEQTEIEKDLADNIVLAVEERKARESLEGPEANRLAMNLLQTALVANGRKPKLQDRSDPVPKAVPESVAQLMVDAALRRTGQGKASKPPGKR